MKFPPLSDGLTAAERVLGRRILTEPPSLHDWIRKFGGFANVPPEGWREYEEAKRQWEADRVGDLQGSAGRLTAKGGGYGQ
jgi:hypothetical protein